MGVLKSMQPFLVLLYNNDRILSIKADSICIVQVFKQPLKYYV